MPEHININGEIITPDNLSQWKTDRSGIEADLAAFLDEWFSDSPGITLQTSGSTGHPKIITADRESMRASARMTCEFFGLTTASSALLALPLRYIAGKMMVVRAIVSGCKLIIQEPSSTPLANIKTKLDFIPMVPMQAITTLQQTNGEEQLSRARSILLGGGFIDPELSQALQHIPSQIFASYGMTETLSHIALRRVNGNAADEWYTPLPGIEISLSPAGTLQLSAPKLGIQHLMTNDIAEINAKGRFRILGRRDFVINSGGIKIQAEEIEQQLRSACKLNLIIVPAPHPVLGQCVALVWEGPTYAEVQLRQAIATLPERQRPRLIRHLKQLPLTATGKPDRRATIDIISTTEL